MAVLAVVALAAAAGIGAWLWARKPGPQRPEITVYSHGHLTRVGPYIYCDVLLKDCENPQTLGELRVTGQYPVQLSVPEAISRGPWRLVQEYEDQQRYQVPNYSSSCPFFRPGTRLALTIPTFDPHRGRLTGIAVQLLTLGCAYHAEWSVRLVY